MFYQTHSSKFHTVINTTEVCSDTVKELLLLFACSYLFILLFTSAYRHLQANLSSASTNRTTSASSSGWSYCAIYKMKRTLRVNTVEQTFSFTRQ